MRRSGRKSVAPQRYEPDEMPEDDSSGSDDMLGQDEEDVASMDTQSTGSLADFLTSDDEVAPDSDAGDPDWEMDSSASFSDTENDNGDSDAD